jgi:hypothetical protein
MPSWAIDVPCDKKAGELPSLAVVCCHSWPEQITCGNFLIPLGFFRDPLTNLLRK